MDGWMDGWIGEMGGERRGKGQHNKWSVCSEASSFHSRHTHTHSHPHPLTRVDCLRRMHAHFSATTLTHHKPHTVIMTTTPSTPACLSACQPVRLPSLMPSVSAYCLFLAKLCEGASLRHGWMAGPKGLLPLVCVGAWVGGEG